jgi:hypothetical protein
VVAKVQELAHQYNFFHWHLAFPQVFARGGFDVVLGNPPWERVKLQEQEFFASRSEVIAKAVNSAARKKLVAELPITQAALWNEWCEASRAAGGQSHFVRQSGRYALCGKGDVNTYALFAEHNRSVLRPKGHAGFIVPAGLVTDDTTKEYFQNLVTLRHLASVYHFENEEKIFPGVHNAFRFLLVTIDVSGSCKQADLVFFARQVGALDDAQRHVSLSPADFAILNPNSRTCPTFRFRRDADINLGMYGRSGVLDNESTNDSEDRWDVQVCTKLFDMADDSTLFRRRAELDATGLRIAGNRFSGAPDDYLPLYEAKMVHHFDHRFGTYEGATEAHLNKGYLPQLQDAHHLDPHLHAMPEYWVASRHVEERLHDRWARGWLLGWRDITGTEKRRTVVASIIPRVAVGHTTRLLFVNASAPLVSGLYANLCSLPLDYAARQKVGGTHLTWGALRQLPVLPPSTYQRETRWARDTIVLNWIVPRVLELTYTAWDIEAFAKEMGYEGAPFRWDAERRQLLRAELDAAFFHLYGLSREDIDYVIETFPILRGNDEKVHGEFRTKRIVLEIYDALSTAAQTGRPYRSLLDPPPGTLEAGHATYSSDGTPKDYAEALRTGLIFTLVRRNGDVGISTATLSRALLWIQDPRQASSWMDPSSLLSFEHIRESALLVAKDASQSQVTKLLDALENERAVTRDSKGVVRIRAGSSIPNWLPQTPALASLASAMLAALERAEKGAASSPVVEKARGGKAKRE